MRLTWFLLALLLFLPGDSQESHIFRAQWFCPRHGEYFKADHFQRSWLCRRSRDKFIEKQRAAFNKEMIEMGKQGGR